MNNDQIIELMDSCKTDPNKFRQEIFKDPQEFTKNIELSSAGYFQLFVIYGFDLLELLPPRELKYFINIGITIKPLQFTDLVYHAISH